MLVSRLGLISGFAFHAAEGRRLYVSLRGTLGSSLPSAYQQAHACWKRSSVSMSTAHQQQATKIVTGVRELCDKYDGFILDQFGVLHGEQCCIHHRSFTMSGIWTNMTCSSLSVVSYE